MYSVRSCSLERDPDPSCVYCVMALLKRCCKSRGIDATAIFENVRRQPAEPFGFPEQEVLAQGNVGGRDLSESLDPASLND